MANIILTGITEDDVILKSNQSDGIVIEIDPTVSVKSYITDNDILDTGSTCKLEQPCVVPTKVSQLNNDLGFIIDNAYHHTDNNYIDEDKAIVATIPELPNVIAEAINATTEANIAADTAYTAASTANIATANTNTATDNAIIAITNANTATADVNTVIIKANTAIDATNTATDNAIQATENAVTAITNANNATADAIIATSAANTATNNANIATINANNATDATITATNNAITATTNAQSVSNHPGYIGSDYYVYTWNYIDEVYVKTDTLLRPDAFSIYKTYTSISNMELDKVNVPEGKYILINTGSVEDVDNAKLYVKGVADFEYLVDMSGTTGATGNGISSINKTSINGLIDTYTITYTSGATSIFTVTNGEKGDQGVSIVTIAKTNTVGLVDTYTITFSDTSTTTFTVTNGVGISSINKTGTSDLVDTYTVTLSNGTTSTFTVTNGQKGDTGSSGVAIQDTEPTDPSINVWIKPDGTGDNYYTTTETDTLLNTKVDKTSIVQVSGTNTDKVISQNAITLLLKAITDNADLQGNVMAEAIVLLLSEVSTLKERLANGNLGDIHVTSITSDSMFMYCGQSLVIKGSGSPVTNAVLPAFEGQIYVDTTNRNVYMCSDSSSATYWKQLN